jgi:phage head maturation protease
METMRPRLAEDLVIAMERGDVSQMSVGMLVESDSWSADAGTRSISRFRELLDVSAVTYPASPSKSTSLAGMSGRVA